MFKGSDAKLKMLIEDKVSSVRFLEREAGMSDGYITHKGRLLSSVKKRIFAEKMELKAYQDEQKRRLAGI